MTSFSRRIDPQESTAIDGILNGNGFAELVSGRHLAPLFVSRDHSKAHLAFELQSICNYPWEWSFDMLKDAALSVLEVCKRLLEEGWVLQQTPPAMCQRGHMLVVDLTCPQSIDKVTRWSGAHKLCSEYVFPLFAAANGIPFQFWWRGRHSGICADDISRLLGDDKSRSLVGMLGLATDAQSSSLSIQAPPLDELQTVFDRTAAWVAELQPAVSPADAHWLSYAPDAGYSERQREQKLSFIAETLDKLAAHRLVDIGANTGMYSLPFADTMRSIVAIDIEPMCVNQMYAALHECVTPLVGDIVHPSPPMLGARPQTSLGLFDRLDGDAFLAVAVIHHVCVPQSLPVAEFVRRLRLIAPGGVVEWVPPDEPMVADVLAELPVQSADYTWENFVAQVSVHFELSECRDVGQRRLCRLMPKSSGPGLTLQ